jgi:hypothetical protein
VVFAERVIRGFVNSLGFAQVDSLQGRHSLPYGCKFFRGVASSLTPLQGGHFPLGSLKQAMHLIENFSLQVAHIQVDTVQSMGLNHFASICLLGCAQRPGFLRNSGQVQKVWITCNQAPWLPGLSKSRRQGFARVLNRSVSLYFPGSVGECEFLEMGACHFEIQPPHSLQTVGDGSNEL